MLNIYLPIAEQSVGVFSLLAVCAEMTGTLVLPPDDPFSLD